MFKYSDVNAVHLELTSYCNLKCPQCARVKDGGTLEGLPLSHLSIDTVRKIFSEMSGQLNYVHICGNYGDPILYPDLLDCIDCAFKHGAGFIKLYSNASLKDSDYWRELGKKLCGEKGQVVFSIDGLKDTNAYYRVGSNWKVIMDNAKAFIDSGGNAVWEWLPFEHNDHQIKQAIKLAEDMGFNAIIFKKNPRFSPLNNGENKNLKPSRVLVHEGVLKAEKLRASEGLQPTLMPIRCKYKARNMIYIDFQGYLLPCCWHGNRFKGKDKYNDLHKVFKRYGFDQFDVSKRTIKEILNNHWYSKSMKYTIKILDTCRKHCSFGVKMSNVDNRESHVFRAYKDPEPWEHDNPEYKL